MTLRSMALTPRECVVCPTTGRMRFGAPNCEHCGAIICGRPQLSQMTKSQSKVTSEREEIEEGTP